MSEQYPIFNLRYTTSLDRHISLASIAAADKDTAKRILREFLECEGDILERCYAARTKYHRNREGIVESGYADLKDCALEGFLLESILYK